MSMNVFFLFFFTGKSNVNIINSTVKFKFFMTALVRFGHLKYLILYKSKAWTLILYLIHIEQWCYICCCRLGQSLLGKDHLMSMTILSGTNKRNISHWQKLIADSSFFLAQNSLMSFMSEICFTNYGLTMYLQQFTLLGNTVKHFMAKQRESRAHKFIYVYNGESVPNWIGLNQECQFCGGQNYIMSISILVVEYTSRLKTMSRCKRLV